MLAPLLVVMACTVAQARTKTSELRESAEAIGERALTSAIEGVKSGAPGACDQLGKLLELYWWPPLDERLEWPRVMRVPIPSAVKATWRPAADACISEALKAPRLGLGLLQSPLLHDDALRAKAIARGDGEHIGRGGGGGGLKLERSIPPTENEPLLLSPGLDAGSVVAQIRRNRNQVTYCYERELLQRPGLRGALDVEFTIVKTDGKPVEVMKVSSSIDDPVVELCVLHRIPNWPFPRPKSTEPRVRYRFELRPLPEK